MVESSWIERFYTHFLGRDITYLFAGGLFITIARYTFRGSFYFPEKVGSFEFSGYLLGAYFLGIGISEIGTLCGVEKEPSKLKRNCHPLPVGYLDVIALRHDLYKYCDDRVINYHERTIFLMHVAAVVGLSALFGSILMFLMLGVCYYNWLIKINCCSQKPVDEYIVVMMVLFLYGVLMVFFVRKERLGQIEKQRNSLIRQIKK